MKRIFPKKIKENAHFRVIAPSRSLSLIPFDRIKIAIERYNSLGIEISFGAHAKEMDDFTSSSIESRVLDLHDAFSDKSVDAILTSIGGYNSNQILSYLDYDLIQSNPKVLCGFSDISALSNAIYAKTGLVGYSGPHFSTLSMVKGIDYTIEYFLKCFRGNGQFEVKCAPEWSDDLWFIDQENRDFISNEGYWNITKCTKDVTGIAVGGHLRCLNSLQGTQFMPPLAEAVVFAEEDDEITPALFDRQLQSLIHQKDFSGVKALVIGRFQKKTGMTKEILEKIILTKQELRSVPVVANYDFGHTTPIFTFPIGGTVRLSFDEQNSPRLFIIEH
jgi:muramoyltetrapeptide carboxypeptidase